MKRQGLLASVLSVLSTVGGAMAQPAPTTLPPGVVTPPPAATTTQEIITAPAEGWSAPLEGAANTPRIWVTPEYLLWWIRSGPVSTPLVTTTTNPAANNSAGVNAAAGLGQAGTVILFGDKAIDYGSFSGGRLTVGGWLNEGATIGMMGRGFLLQQESRRDVFSSGPSGSPVIGIPIFDVSGLFGGGENAIVVSSGGVPGALPTAGYQEVVTRSQLWGAECNGMFNLLRSNTFVVNGLAGFRYLDLREDLTLTSLSYSLLAPTDPFFTGITSSVDTFRTRNQFYGGQVGLDSTAWMGNAFVNVQGRFAAGSTHQLLIVNGASAIQFPTTAATFPGGTLALPSNSGRFTHNAFTVVPEVECNIGYALTQNVRAFVGYNFLYSSNVIRPANQIDRNVDVRTVPTLPTYIPGFFSPSPAHVFHQTDFWAQGINFGVNLAF